MRSGRGLCRGARSGVRDQGWVGYGEDDGLRADLSGGG